MALDLNSTKWTLLQDAYGAATGIPSLLTLLRDKNVDSLDELYGRICHQGSIYSASIAAFPHLVLIAENAGFSRIQVDILSLAGAICESRDIETALFASDYADSFKASIPTAEKLAVAALPRITDPNSGIYLLKAALSFSAFVGPARVLDGFVNEEFALSCPCCGADLYVWPAPEGLAVAAEDPVSFPSTTRIPVAKGPISSPQNFKVYGWLTKVLSSTPSLAMVASQIPYLFGTASCPACAASFSLFDALIDEAT
jgi:hypothetical protein